VGRLTRSSPLALERSITLHQLRVFKAVADNLSFSQAAHGLRLSQPSVSYQVKELEDHVLRAHPRRELADQPDTPDLGHREIEGLTRDRERDLEAAGADGEHAEGAGGAGVAVGPDHRPARRAEALHVHRVADAVAGLAEPEPEALARALEKEVVVGVAEVGLEHVVIDVLRRQLCVRVVEVHRLELEHDHRARRILGQRLVDPDPDLGAGRHVALHEMGTDELLRDVLGHATTLDSPNHGT